jgi:hypothetical protein
MTCEREVEETVAQAIFEWKPLDAVSPAFVVEAKKEFLVS